MPQQGRWGAERGPAASQTRKGPVPRDAVQRGELEQDGSRPLGPRGGPPSPQLWAASRPFLPEQSPLSGLDMFPHSHGHARPRSGVGVLVLSRAAILGVA